MIFPFLLQFSYIWFSFDRVTLETLMKFSFFTGSPRCLDLEVSSVRLDILLSLTRLIHLSFNVLFLVHALNFT